MGEADMPRYDPQLRESIHKYYGSELHGGDCFHCPRFERALRTENYRKIAEPNLVAGFWPCP